jgi:hypothetical protein
MKFDGQDYICSSQDGKTGKWHRIGMFWQAYADKDMFIWQTNVGPNESISPVYVASIDDKNTVMSGIMSNFSGKNGCWKAMKLGS